MKRRRNVYAALAVAAVLLTVLVWQLVVRADEAFDETDDISMSFDGERATPDLDRSPVPYFVVGGVVAIGFALLAWRNAVGYRDQEALINRDTSARDAPPETVHADDES